MTIMFQPQFEALILSGRKPHTIRPKRKIPLPLGQPLSLRVWTGKPYRSKQREFHSANVQKVEPIRIEANRVILAGKELSVQEIKDLAWHDGFDDAFAAREWFQNTHGLPFDGELIRWRCA